MKRLIVVLAISASANLLTLAQAGPARDVEGEKLRERIEAYNRQVDRLRNLEKTIRRVDPNQQFVIYTSRIKPLYRKPTKNELDMVAPEAADIVAHSQFLKQKDTGIVKLIADQGCSKDLLVADSRPHCVKYSMPGAASSFSFRMESHWLRHLSDITFDGEKFLSSLGELTNGILIDIGDVPLDRIDPRERQYQTVRSFAAPVEMQKASNLAALLETGINDGEIVYKSSAQAKENSTYLLRSIAYRGDSMRIIEDVAFNEFDFDVREDLFAVFRVIRLAPNESVTIVWRILERKESPKLKK